MKTKLIIIAMVAGFAIWYGYNLITIAKEVAAYRSQQLKAIDLE